MKMGAGLAGVLGSENPVADGKMGPLQPLSAAYINDVWVRRSDCDVPDRLRRLSVKDGHPRAAVIGRLPNAAVDCANVEHIGLVRHARSGPRTAATKRADHPPVHLAEHFF